MVLKPRLQTNRLERAAGRLLCAMATWIAWLGSAAPLPAQQPEVHYLSAGAMPPGAIGGLQLTRGGPLPGYFQPVEITGPKGCRIAAAVDGRFEPPQPGTMLVGMLIGSVYRLRVTNIPDFEAMEVYPTIEVIDRLFPPVGLEGRFPITIELDQDELQLALAGKFVTRVVYLEEPEAALPVAEAPRQQEAYQVAPGQNPLDVADRLGRPMAIVRMGGRVPDASGPDPAFLFGSPPLLRFQTPPKGFPGNNGYFPGASGEANSSTALASAGSTSPGSQGPPRQTLTPVPDKRSRLDLRNAFRPRETRP